MTPSSAPPRSTNSACRWRAAVCTLAFPMHRGGSDMGVNIPGNEFSGGEPYSPVDRIERRFEFTDNLSLVRGRHTFKIGADINILQLRSSKPQIFQLDFGGDVNFGGLSASTFGFP